MHVAVYQCITHACIHAYTANNCTPSSHADITVGFNDDNYTVTEGEGSVSVCVHVQQGRLADGVELNLGFITENGTAQGE